MNICHINNVANLPYTVAEEQRKRGHEVTVFNLTPSYKYWSGNVLAPWARFMVEWGKFDVVFAHSCGVLPRFLESAIGQPNVVYWHHGSDVRGKQCRLPLKPHLVSNPDLLACCEGSRYMPYPLDLDYWKSEREGKGTLDIGKVKNVPWDKMKALLDAHHTITQDKGLPSYSTTIAQAMALDKEIIVKGVDWSLYPSEPDLTEEPDGSSVIQHPREFAEKYHDVRLLAPAITDFGRRE